jgi:cytochrome c553
MIKFISFCIATLGMLSAMGAAAQGAAAQAAAPVGDPNAGRSRTAMCAGCHEIPGWQTAFPETYKVPRIIGQHPAYIVSALQAYKRGDRAHPSMRAIAASLSDKDMADLAAYYGQQGMKTAAK